MYESLVKNIRDGEQGEQLSSEDLQELELIDFLTLMAEREYR